MIQRLEPKQELMVTEKIAGAHPQHPDYPLLPEDLVKRQPDGTWYKYAPGMGVTGFVLSEEQVQKLKAVWVISEHLVYEVAGDVAPGEESLEILAQKRPHVEYDF